MNQTKQHQCTPKKKFDYILWPSAIVIVIGYVINLLHLGLPQPIETFSSSVVELIHKMWWGLVFAIIFVGALHKIPRELVMGVLGTKRGLNGILRATAAGVLLDLCSHGILVVGMKLYERGASLGQVMAFLIASPWNSFAMTLILIALIGLSKTLVFILLSCCIAIFSGWIFEQLVRKGALPENPHSTDLAKDLKVWPELKKVIKSSNWSITNIADTLREGLRSSKMVLRWIFFGVALASLIRVLLTPENYETYFGPSLAGLGLTLIAATIIEVCSEGSAPIAADLVTLGKAPGNGFVFLMAGVSTDYTEVMSLKDTTKSWKIALFLPLVTVPQIVLLGYFLNFWVG